MHLATESGSDHLFSQKAKSAKSEGRDWKSVPASRPAASTWPEVAQTSYQPSSFHFFPGPLGWLCVRLPRPPSRSPLLPCGIWKPAHTEGFPCATLRCAVFALPPACGDSTGSAGLGLRLPGV